MPATALRPRCAIAALGLFLLLLRSSCPTDDVCELVLVAQVPLELKNHVFVVPVTVNGHAIEIYDLDIDGQRRLLTLYRVRRCDPAPPPWHEPAALIDGFSVQTGWLKVPFRLDAIEGFGFLDTGASNTMITPGMARRLSLTDQALANDRMINNHVVAGDDTPSHVHWFNIIQIGPVEERHPYAYVLASEPPPMGGDRKFGDGVIGLDFWGGQHIWISVRTGRLYLARGNPG